MCQLWLAERAPRRLEREYVAQGIARPGGQVVGLLVQRRAADDQLGEVSGADHAQETPAAADRHAVGQTAPPGLVAWKMDVLPGVVAVGSGWPVG